MARIRTIKPEFFTSEDIVELEPLARLLYIALWCEADKEGRLPWKPKTFKMRYLPADGCDIDALCDALLTRGLLVTYGDGLAYIPSFKNHQHINPREKDSVLPDPIEEPVTRQLRVNDASVTCREEGRKERKGTRVAEQDVLFGRFYDLYPKKVGKDAAKKAFDKRNVNEELLDQMLKAIEQQKQTPAWTKDNGQYIPNPSTWLNQGRWMDECGAEESQSLLAGCI